MRWARPVACVGEKGNSYSVLTRKPAEERLFWRPMCRREDIIKTCFKEMEWEGMDWINVADWLKGQVIDWLLWTWEWTFLTRSETVSFSRRTLLHAIGCLVSKSLLCLIQCDTMHELAWKVCCTRSLLFVLHLRYCSVSLMSRSQSACYLCVVIL